MDEELVQALIADARNMADYAAAVRTMHRKRSTRGNRQREADIAIALARLRRAMRPIRSELGRAPYGKNGCATPMQQMELAEASRIIQRERRKLWKMRERPSKRKRP